jgi:hypothetical protein
MNKGYEKSKTKPLWPTIHLQIKKGRQNSEPVRAKLKVSDLLAGRPRLGSIPVLTSDKVPLICLMHVNKLLMENQWLV